MTKRLILVLSLIFAMVSMVASQGYVYQNTSRPSVDSDTDFFKLDLDFSPEIVEEGDIIVLTTRDLGDDEPVEGAKLYFEDEYLGETGSTGSYRFSIEEAGSYDFRAEIAGYEDRETLEVLEPASERYTVESSGMISGDFLAYTSSLDYLFILLAVSAFFGGYLQHTGRFTVFKIVE